MEEFTVDRKKIVWLTALAGAFALVCAARDGASEGQISTRPPTAETAIAAAGAGAAAGIFEGHRDVGTVLHPGAVEFDAAEGSYTIAGSGGNMLLAPAAFEFARKQMSV